MKTAYLRTQILLPVDLRQMIDWDRQQRNESLSEYLRKAAQLRLAKERKRKVDLKQLAGQVIGGLDLSKYPEWINRKAVGQWQKELRREKGV